MEALAAISILVGAGLVALLLAERHSRRSARQHMAGRVGLSSGEFGCEFYPEHAALASRVRDVLADHIPIDLAGLRPKDEPVRDLRMDDLDSMATAEFIIALEEEFDIEFPESDAAHVRTVDDIVRRVVALVEEKQAAGAS